MQAVFYEESNSPYIGLELISEQFKPFNEDYEDALNCLGSVIGEIGTINTLSDSGFAEHIDAALEHAKQIMGFLGSVGVREKQILQAQKQIANALGAHLSEHASAKEIQNVFDDKLAQNLQVKKADLKSLKDDIASKEKIAHIRAIADIHSSVEKLAIEDAQASQSAKSMKIAAMKAAYASKMVVSELLNDNDFSDFNDEFSDGLIYKALITPDKDENIYNLGGGKYYYAKSPVSGVNFDKSLADLAALGVHKLASTHYTWALGTNGWFYGDDVALVGDNSHIEQKSFNDFLNALYHGTIDDIGRFYGNETKSYARLKDGSVDLSKPLKISPVKENGKYFISYSNIQDENHQPYKFFINQDTKAFPIVFGVEERGEALKQNWQDDAAILYYKGEGYNNEYVDDSLLLSKADTQGDFKISMNGYSFVLKGDPIQAVSQLLLSNGAGIYTNLDDHFASLESLDDTVFEITTTNEITVKSGLKLPASKENIYFQNNKFAIYAPHEINNASDKSLQELKELGASWIGIKQNLGKFSYIDLQNEMAYEDGSANINGQLLSGIMNESLGQISDEIGLSGQAG